jgi:phosphatidylinositol alpha 1,6-mannosyltransferase
VGDGPAAASLRRELPGPQRRAAYGLAARAAVRERTWSAVGDELIGHYLAVRGGGLLTGQVEAMAA